MTFFPILNKKIDICENSEIPMRLSNSLTISCFMTSFVIFFWICYPIGQAMIRIFTVEIVIVILWSRFHCWATKIAREALILETLTRFLWGWENLEDKVKRKWEGTNFLSNQRNEGWKFNYPNFPLVKTERWKKFWMVRLQFFFFELWSIANSIACFYFVPVL